jgi:hypothetical protein
MRHFRPKSEGQKDATKIATDWLRRFPMERQRNRSLAIADLLFRVIAPLLSRRPA